jgi:hypothetical protein
MEKVIDKNGNEVIIFETDLGKLNWKEANELCEKLGNGWRLPNTEELRLMYNNLHLKKLGNFENNYYWSSEIKSDFGNKKVFDMIGMAKVVHFKHGNITFPEMHISFEHSVRPVKYEGKKVLLEFNYRCRKCLYGNLNTESLTLEEYNIPFIFGQSEYFAAEKLKEKLSKKCSYCFSRDIEFYDIEIENKKIFNENRYKAQLNDYFEISLDNKNGVIQTNISGAKYLTYKFKQKLITKLSSVLTKYLDDEQPNLNHGNFHFVYRGYINNGDQAYRTERLLNSGIPFIELEKIIVNAINILKTS